MSSVQSRFFLEWSIRRPRSVVAVILVVTLFFVAQIVDFRSGVMRLGIDASVAGLLPGDTPGRLDLERLERTFGEREPVIVALGMNDVFQASSLRAVDTLTRELYRLPGVVEVMSLATVDTVRSESGETFVEPLVSRMSGNPASLAQLRREILGNRLYAGNLVSRDGSTAVILVYFDEETLESDSQGTLLHGVAETARQHAAEAEVFVTGAPYVKAATAELLLRDFTSVFPLAALATVGVAIAVFRTVAGVVVSCSGVLIGVAWILGGLAWLGRPLNLVTIIVPPLLLSVGFAYVVHVVSDYVDEVGPKGSRSRRVEALQKTLRSVGLPIVLTGLTTIAGFLSLVVSPFAAVREFGFIAVVGVAVTVFLSLTYAPALLALFPTPRRSERSGASTGWIEFLARRLADFSFDHRQAVMLLGGGALVLSLLAASQIRVNTEIIENFPQGHPVRTGFMAVSERLDGGNSFNVVLEAEHPDAFLDPRVLAPVDEFETWLENQPEIGSATSLLDHLKLIHRTFRDDDPAFETVPDRAGLSKQLLLLAGTRDLVAYTDSDYRTLNIHVRARTVDTESLAALLDRVRERLAVLPGDLKPRVTGTTVLLASAIDDIAGGQLRSLGLAFAFIFCILALLFMSLRVGAIALIPNALPVAMYFGLLGATGIPLDTTTGLLACIVLGIAVDDTIHFLTRFNHEARVRTSELEGARHAVRFVARPVTVTTLALCVGLLVLTASELQNQVRFGALGASVLAIAWLVDLTFTPALCSRLKIVTLWDVLSYDLGAAPQESIPLFAGLSKTQARIVALATRIVEIPAGTNLCRRGDPGVHLWVIVHGELEVSLEVEGRRRVLERLGRGSVVGEVAVFYGNRRSADVDALTDVRAVRLSKENLARFRSRYPRIAARVLWNLSQTLAERLVSADRRLQEDREPN